MNRVRISAFSLACAACVAMSVFAAPETKLTVAPKASVKTVKLDASAIGLLREKAIAVAETSVNPSEVRCRRYDRAKKPEFEAVVHSWDVGATYTGNASVCTKWGLRQDPEFGDCVYLYDLISVKLKLPEVEALIIAENKRGSPALILIDERGCGLGLYQNLKSKGYWQVTGHSSTTEGISDVGGNPGKPNEGKIKRFGRALLAIADGKVVIPSAAPWLERFLYEVAAFPNIADDDQVDSMTQLLGNFDRAARLARRFKERQLWSD